MAENTPEYCEFIADPTLADIAAPKPEPVNALRAEIAEVAARVHRFYHRDRTTATTWETCRFRICRDLQRLHRSIEGLVPHHG